MSGRRAPRPSGVVTLLTDFGLDDAYVGAVKGVLLGINPRARLVDLTHAVPPQDVRRAALLLEGAWRFFPRGSVHLAVVDPGVGERAPADRRGGRRPLLRRARQRAPRVLLRPARRAGGRADRRALPSAAGQPDVPRARRVRAGGGPLLARGAAGGARARRCVTRCGWPRSEPRRRGRRVVGEVLLVDRFGNLLTSLRGRDLPGPADRGVLRVGGARIRGLAGTYAERPRGALGAVIDSSGRVEVFVREGSARRRLGVGRGRPGQLDDVGAGFGCRSVARALRGRLTLRGVSLFEDVSLEAAAVPVVVEAVEGASVDFFSASIPFFRPAEG